MTGALTGLQSENRVGLVYNKEGRAHFTISEQNETFWTADRKFECFSSGILWP